MIKKSEMNTPGSSTPIRDPQIEYGTINRRVETNELEFLIQNDESDPYFDSIKEMEVVLRNLIYEIDQKGFKIFENDYKKQMQDFKKANYIMLTKSQQEKLEAKLNGTQGLNELNSSILSQYIINHKIRQEVKTPESIQKWIDGIYDKAETDFHDEKVAMTYEQKELLRKECDHYIQKYFTVVMNFIKQRLKHFKIENQNLNQKQKFRQSSAKSRFSKEDVDSTVVFTSEQCLRNRSKKSTPKSYLMDIQYQNDHVHTKECTMEYYNPMLIQESKYRPIYENIQNKLMNSYSSTEIQPNQVSTFKKCLHSRYDPKTNKQMKPSCKGNKLCGYERMAADPTLDQSSIVPLPFTESPSGYNSKKVNYDFANADFKDRNLILKEPHLRVIATEESLDEWQGQSMGVTGEKIYRTRRALFQNQLFAHIGTQSMTVKKPSLKKTTTNDQLSQDDSSSVNTKPKQDQSVTPTAADQKALNVQYQEYHEEFKKIIEQNRPSQATNTIKDFEDLKPTTYSIYQNQKSFLTEGRKISPKNKSEEPYKWKPPQDKKKGKKSKYTLQNERRILMKEIGGFSQKEIKDRYFDAFHSVTQKLQDERNEQRSLEKARMFDPQYTNRSLNRTNQNEVKNTLQMLVQENQRLSAQKLVKSRTRNIPVLSKTNKTQYLDRKQSHRLIVQNTQTWEQQQQSSRQNTTRAIFSNQNTRLQKNLQYRNASNPDLHKKKVGAEQYQQSSKSNLKILIDNKNSIDFYKTQYTHDSMNKSFQPSGDNSSFDQIYGYGNSESKPNSIKQQISFRHFKKNTNQMRIQDTQSQYPGIAQKGQFKDKLRDEVTSSLQGSTQLTQRSLNSLSEQQFFELNSNLKGHNVTDDEKKQVLIKSQNILFNTQKRKMINILMKQTHGGPIKIQKQKSHLVKEETHCSHGHDHRKTQSPEIIKPIQDAHQHQGDHEHGEYDEEKWKLFVKRLMNQIDIDNQEDLEKPPSTLSKFDACCQSKAYQTNLTPNDFPPQDRLRKRKLDFQDGDFWFLKGYDHAQSNREEELDSAIDSYRHAIRLDHMHPSQVNHEEDDDCLHMCVHNLACGYSTQTRYELASTWFQLAIDIDPECEQAIESYYGYALCQFKLGKPKESIKYLNRAIHMCKDDIFDKEGAEVNHHKRTNAHYRYFRALCHKVCGNHCKSERDYTNILKQFEIQEGKKMSKNLFAMLVLPLEQSRKILLQFVDEFKCIIDKYEAQEVDRRKISMFNLEHIERSQVFMKDNVNPQWIDKKIPLVIRALQQIPFFKRFRNSRLFELINMMKVNIIKSKKLLFIDPKKVYVIVSGSILMQSHKKRFDLPETLAKFTEGNIINHLQEDCPHFQCIETWYFAQVETEIAIFDKQYFQNVWQRDLTTGQIKLDLRIIKCQKIFKGLSELSLVSLVSEFMVKKKYKKGELIAQQSKYSPANIQYRVFYQEHALKFVDRMKNWKNKTRQRAQRKPEQQTMQFMRDTCCLHNTNKPKINSNTITSTVNTPVKRSRKGSFSNTNYETTQNITMNQTQNQSHDQICASSVPSKTVSPPRRGRRQGIKGKIAFPFTQVNEDPNFGKEKEENAQDGMYLILSGTAKIVNSKDNYEAKQLKFGDYFGESEMMRIIGYDFFGDIYADSDEVECFFISRENFRKIALFEVQKIKQHAQEREIIYMLAYKYSKRYNIDLKEFGSFYG